MTRIYFACLFLCLTTTFLLSQSNPVPPINQSMRVASPISASQLSSGRFRAAARRKAPMQTQEPIFAPAVTYDSGGQYADSVAVADVNGDSKPDLVVANQCVDANCANGSVSVLLGNGDGTFQPVVTYGSGGASPSSVAVADVNGDSKPDLVVANQCVDANCATGSVSVLLGNGDGTFQAPVTYGSGGFFTFSVAVADVNGDGKPDLLVANWCPDAGDCGSPNAPTMDAPVQEFGRVGVLLGNGDGTFQAAVVYNSGGYRVNSVAVGDVNGDGKPDLLVVNEFTYFVNGDGSDVGVLLGNGDGTFQAPVNYISGGWYAFSGAVGDVNGDGKPDLLVTNSGPCELCQRSTVGVLLGNGDGTFQAVVTYVSGGLDARSVAVGDVNGDSKPDLVVANQCVDANCATGSVSVLLGNGDGTFQPAVTYGSGGTNAAAVTVADLNGDGKPDVAVANYNTSSVGVLLNISSSPTTTTLLSSVNPSVSGKPVTFTATVSSSSGGTPTGKVQFLNGTAVLATVRLTSGSAKYTTLKLPPGTNIMTAVYEGDSKNNGSTSAPVDQFVLAATTTTLKSSLNPSVYGQSVVFTATVTSSIGAPPDGETVTFKQGTTVLGAVTMSGGTATFSISTLGVGTKSVTAVYGGDSNFAASTSKALKQVVNKATTTTTLASSQNPSSLGQSVTFTASVTPQFSGKVTGTVTFYDGATALKTVSMSGGVAKFTTSTLAAGEHSITATYNGSTSFTGSSASLMQTVN